MATLAERALELGLTTTTWFDTSQGHPGVERHGILNPAANDWRTRYGTSGVMIEYNPRNWAGAHAPAGNIDAPAVVYEVFKQLGRPIEPSLNDLSDLDLIDGLTRFVMDQAARLRITANSMSGGGSGRGNGSSSTGDGADPCASIKADLAAANEKVALLQHNIAAVSGNLDTVNSTLKSIAKTLKGVTIRGGGQAWNVVRQIDKLVNG